MNTGVAPRYLMGWELAQKVNDWPKLDVATLKKVHEKIDSGWSVHL